MDQPTAAEIRDYIECLAHEQKIATMWLLTHGQPNEEGEYSLVEGLPEGQVANARKVSAWLSELAGVKG